MMDSFSLWNDICFNLNPPIILSCLRNALCFQYLFLFVKGKFVFLEIGGRNGKFLSESERLMINRYETENELCTFPWNEWPWTQKGQTNETKRGQLVSEVQ